MKTGHQRIAIDLIEMNTGQIAGLPSNPRQWTKAQLDNLKASIEETPELLEARGCIVDYHEGKYVCLGGNMRYAACKALGMSELPCYVVPEGTSILKKKQIVAKDNVSMGDWDFDALANEWGDLDLAGWGVSIPPEWGAAAADAAETDSRVGQAKDDEFDEKEAQIEKKCSKGDIWRLGEHRLMCGDSTDEAAIKRLMDGDKADMVFTDPPYGVSIGDKNAALNSVQKAGRCCKNIENDTLSADELYPILVKAMTNARLSCKEDACYFVTSPQGGELGLMMMMMKDAGLPVRHMLIWEKNSATFSLGRLDYDYQHEPIFYTWTKKHHNYRKGQYRTTIWKYDKPRKCDLHPTMKPVELVANCLNDATKAGDIALDVFGGSGTTMIACEQLGRRARLIELDPHYCDVIIARWEKFTGMTAEKIE